MSTENTQGKPVPSPFGAVTFAIPANGPRRYDAFGKTGAIAADVTTELRLANGQTVHLVGAMFGTLQPNGTIRFDCPMPGGARRGQPGVINADHTLATEYRRHVEAAAELWPDLAKAQAASAKVIAAPKIDRTQSESKLVWNPLVNQVGASAVTK